MIERGMDSMKLVGLSCIFPAADIKKTAEFYQTKLGFRPAEYLENSQPHICLYKDDVEIILTQADCEEIKPNRCLYGYGYDAYIYTHNQLELQKQCQIAGVKIVKPLVQTDYGNKEFIIEDIDGRWIAFGLKEER